MRIPQCGRRNERMSSRFRDKVAEYAERELAGKPVADELEAVQHHLTLCAECGEEYEALITALKGRKEPAPPGDSRPPKGLVKSMEHFDASSQFTIRRVVDFRHSQTTI